MYSQPTEGQQMDTMETIKIFIRTRRRRPTMEAGNIEIDATILRSIAVTWILRLFKKRGTDGLLMIVEKVKDDFLVA